MRATFGDCELDGDRRELRRNGVKVAIQPKVMGLLLFLVQERHRVVPRRELLEALWPDVVVGDGSLSYAVLELRRAIGDDAQVMIETVRGFGFRAAMDITLVEPVAPAAPAPPAPPPPPSPVRSTSLFGRDVQLGALAGCLEQARGGRGAFAWISGEAGSGKTRIVEEIAARARALDVRVASAIGHEEPTPPFWGWQRIAAALAAGEADGPALVTAASQLVDEEGAERLRSFGRLTSLLAASAKPLVLVFDDVQWLDPASLSLLRFFVREVREARVLVIATCRDTAPRADARGALLADLVRAAAGLSFALRGLEADDVRALVALRLDREPSARFVTAVHGRTGGNPLLVEQLLATPWARKTVDAELLTIASTTELRDEVVASIARHIGAVSLPCQELLTDAALLGSELDVATLLACSQAGHAEVLDAIEEALRARLLQKPGPQKLRFTHSLVSEVLTKRLSGIGRAERHGRIAHALAKHYGEPLERHAGRLAEHFLSAAATGTAPQAVALARRAARHALLASDPRTAERNLVLALQATSFVPGSDGDRLDVLVELGGARVAAAQTEAARGTYQDAALLAQVLGRTEALAGIRAALAALG